MAPTMNQKNEFFSHIASVKIVPLLFAGLQTLYVVILIALPVGIQVYSWFESFDPMKILLWIQGGSGLPWKSFIVSLMMPFQSRQKSPRPFVRVYRTKPCHIVPLPHSWTPFITHKPTRTSEIARFWPKCAFEDQKAQVDYRCPSSVHFLCEITVDLWFLNKLRLMKRRMINATCFLRPQRLLDLCPFRLGLYKGCTFFKKNLEIESRRCKTLATPAFTVPVDLQLL